MASTRARLDELLNLLRVGEQLYEEEETQHSLEAASRVATFPGTVTVLSPLIWLTPRPTCGIRFEAEKADSGAAGYRVGSNCG